MFAIASRFQPKADGSGFEEDISTLTLKCNDETIGVVKFDLASYYGKVDQIEEAPIASEDDPSKPVLVGDIAKYPGASLSFQARVTKTDKATTKSKKTTSIAF